MSFQFKPRDQECSPSTESSSQDQTPKTNVNGDRNITIQNPAVVNINEGIVKGFGDILGVAGESGGHRMIQEQSNEIYCKSKLSTNLLKTGNFYTAKNSNWECWKVLEKKNVPFFGAC